jgi:hypothetical protein
MTFINTGTSSGTTSVAWYLTKTGEPTVHGMRAVKAQHILGRVCHSTGHVGTCGLLSDRYRFDIKIGVRYLSVPNPLHRMWLYIVRSTRHGLR